MSPEGALESHEDHDYTVEEPHNIDWRVSTPAKAYDNLPQWRQKIGL